MEPKDCRKCKHINKGNRGVCLSTRTCVNYDQYEEDTGAADNTDTTVTGEDLKKLRKRISDILSKYISKEYDGSLENLTDKIISEVQEILGSVNDAWLNYSKGIFLSIEGNPKI